MNKKEILLVVLVCIGIFILVYSPHFNYKYPLHVDEWHYIDEAKNLNNNKIDADTFRIGFVLFLTFLGRIFDLVLIYRFFPAIWAVLTALVLFYIVKKTTKNYWIALFSMIFFASLKSNVNIGGLWFFIPSVFCIPLIYLFVYFFSEGIEKQNKKYVLGSLGIIVLTLFIHSASFLFAVPFLFVYSLFHLRYIKKEWKFFSSFLVIPIVGVAFYIIVMQIAYNLSLKYALLNMLSALMFKYGRLPLELNNSFFEVYSLIGFVFAFLGIFYIWRNKEVKRYLAYLLWPALTLLSIIIFRITGISFFAPYQRTFYYFALSLPFLSAFGLYYLLKLKDSFIDRKGLSHENKVYVKKFLAMIIILASILFIFYSYSDIPKQVSLYKLIDNNDYRALLFLKNQTQGRVLSSPAIGSATYAISGQLASGAIFFYGNRAKTEEFFSAKNCSEKNKIIRLLNATYLLVEKPIDCNWTLIYNNTDLIYNVRNVFPISKSQSGVNKSK